MEADLYQKVKDIFQSVLDAPTEKRQELLDDRCGRDERLRAEVERLLDSHESGFLEQPAVAGFADALAPAGLQTGDMVGHYTIVSRIGSGGMGEVYLAEDGKLGRRVAIKLLPAEYTQDDDRLRRFHQEARTASALNHPNILTVFEVGETGGTHYIATEYIDGETLRARLNRGRLPVAEALDVAVQCASGLAAAHESGIIHRDVKPENIMLRPDGIVKVLDFGLAKLAAPASAPARPEISHDAPTERRARTAPGIIMGTVRYMSPEQARGHETDARTDIWSLGVVVYEMASGSPPFAGDTAADLIAEIVKTYPAPISGTADHIPERLDEIVAKTLEKEQDERYQTAKDLLIDLKRLKRKLDLDAEVDRSHAPVRTSSKASLDVTDEAKTAILTHQTADANGRTFSTVSSAEYLVSTISRHKSRLLVLTVLSTTLLGSISFAIWYFNRPTPGPLGRALDSFEITRITGSGKSVAPALSPDGKFVAFFNTEVTSHSLVIRQIATNTDVKVTNPKESPFIPTMRFSNDGAYLFFVTRDEYAGTLFRVPSFGGTPVKLIDDIDSNITFSPDGSRFGFVRWGKDVATVVISNVDGSGQEPFFAEDGEGSIGDIAWSPDGAVLAITKKSGQQPNRSIYAVSLADKSVLKLSEDEWINPGSLSWSLDGSRLLFISRKSKTDPYQLWSIDYPGGRATLLTPDSNNYSSLSSVASNGTMVVERFDFRTSIWSHDLRTNATQQLTPERVDRIGLDGIEQRANGELLVTKREGGWGNFWLLNADDYKGETRLTDETAEHKEPVISSDGLSIVYNSNNAIWRADSDGMNPVQLTRPGDKHDGWPVLLGDDRTVLFERTTEGFETKIMKTSIAGEEPTEILHTPHTEYSGVAYSPELDLLAVGANSVREGSETVAKSSIQFFRVDKAELIPIERKLATNNLGKRVDMCKWSRRGKLICLGYTDFANLFIESETGTFEKLTGFDEGVITNFAPSRDGTQVFVVRGYRSNDIFLIKDNQARPR